MKFEHFLKGPVTSGLGLLVMVASLTLMTLGKLEIMWEGMLILGIGAALLFVKDAIPGWIKSVVDKLLKK